MPRVIASGPNFDANHPGTIVGLHGTIGEQPDETHYDHRRLEESSDSDNDFVECKRIRFPRGTLYGRNEELTKLKEIYYGCAAVEEEKEERRDDDKGETRSARGTPLSATTVRVVFVSGPSGTGKSALVHEFIQQVTDETRDKRRSPLFGSGKFEQYAESAPFLAISEAAAMYANDLLCNQNERNDAEAELGRVRSNFQKCGLGRGDDDTDVLIDVFPMLAPLLQYDSKKPHTNDGRTGNNGTTVNARQGDPKKKKKKALGPHAGRVGLDITRLKIVFANFVAALGRKQNRPIIMFLDDLQWADEASLDMITALLLDDKSLNHFLFIGSYRSNEVSNKDHPFEKFKVDIENGLTDGGAVESMELSGLLPKDVAQFVADATEREVEDVRPIVELVYKKTLGNIFFVMQALEELCRRNILYYDIICYSWSWNLDKNRKELDNFVSENVLGMIKSKIGCLTPECQRALVMMAYTQNTIYAHTVWVMMQADGHEMELLEDVLNLLEEAAGEGLLLQTENDHEYTFAHDLIQEAAYSSIPKGEEQDRLFVQIAKVLVDRSAIDGEEWMLFVAVKHLNSVPKDYIDSLESLVALNLRVANLATSKASLGQAAELLRSGVACLDPRDRWDTKLYDVTLDLFNRLIGTEFSLGNYKRAEAAIEEVLANAASLRDKNTAHLNLVNIAALKNNRNYEAGVQKGLELLKEYGQQIPFYPSKSNLFWERVRLERVRGGRSFLKLVDMPVMHDDSVIKLLEVTLRYEYMGSVSPRLSNVIMSRALSISFSQGICWDLAILALSYGVSMNKKDKLKEANQYSSLAANLQKKFPEALKGGDYVKFQFRLLSCSKVRHPFQEDIERFPDLHQKGLSNGLVDIGMACGLIYANCYFAAGLPLNSLLGSKLLLYEQRAAQMNQDSFLVMFKVCRQFQLNLMRQSGGEGQTVFKGVAFNEEETLRDMEGNSKKMALRDISTYRMQLAYIFNDEATMGEMLERLKGYPLADLSVARGFLRVTFVGLAALLLGKKNRNKDYLRLGRSVIKRYKKLVRAGGSANALPPYLCVRAAMKPTRAAYDKAIKACSDARMTHLEAMMNERCGELLWKEFKDEKNSAEEYLRMAYFLYSDWGAFAKANQLKEQYDCLSSKNIKTKAPTSSIASSSKAGWDGPAFQQNECLRL